MQAEVIAALIGAGASLAVAILTYVHARQSARDAGEAQRRQAGETAALQREQAQLAAEQARQLALLQAELDRQAQERDQRSRREELVYRFREPLARAAYDLQSRLWNILEGRFLETFLLNGTEREKQYAVENTVFLVAQYFAWTEITRREIQFIDLGEEKRTRDLSHLQDRIAKLWGTDRTNFEPRFRVWAGEQRAIGEQLIHEGPRGPSCMGYGRFVDDLLRRDRPPLLAALCDDVAALPQLPTDRLLRLAHVQHALIDLLDQLLDPDHLRFPPDSRTKVTLPESAPAEEKPTAGGGTTGNGGGGGTGGGGRYMDPGFAG
jgi:hypothetical protein